MNRWFSVLITLSFFLLLLLFPSAAIQGASLGLLLWYQKILPVLLPFALASQFMIHTNLIGRLSPYWYVMITGFCCGYPMGAISIDLLVRTGKLEREEGQRLMLFCNQPSPMFLVGYLGIQCLAVTDGLPLILAAYLPPLVLGIILKKHPSTYALRKETQGSMTKTLEFHPLTLPCLEQAWWESCRIVVKIGGFLLFFSVVSAWLNMLLPAKSLPGLILLGMLEMTTGTSQLMDASLTQPIRTALGLFFVSFGGISCLAQTAGCVEKTLWNGQKYLLCKFVCGFSSALLGYIFFL